MNKGIRYARGEWIYFLGADDRLHSHTTLSRIATILSDRNGVVYGNVMSERFGGIYDGAFSYEKLLSKNICHQAMFVSRKTFIEIGNFSLKYPYAADWEFNLRWMGNPSIDSHYVDQTIANYAVGGLSSTNLDIRWQQDQLLLHVQHGRAVLSLRTSIKLLVAELKRGIREMRLKVIAKSALLLLCCIPRIFLNSHRSR